MNLAIAAIFRNEATYLKEWIEFHLSMGFEHFYLFDNLSTDNPRRVLEPYISNGRVELTLLSYDHSNSFEWNAVQCTAYRKALQDACGKTKWLAILDIDEFLFSVDGPIFEVLQPFKRFGGVGVNWQLFGTSNLSKIPEDQPILEVLNLKLPANQGVNHHIKSIVRPECVEDCDNPHSMIYYPGFCMVNTAGVPFEGRVSPTVEISPLRINHYILRDEQYFSTQKIPRLQKSWGGSEEVWRARYSGLNQVEDREIHRFL